MPIVTKVRSGSSYEPRFSYSRLVKVDDWILMSNTSGRDFKTGAMPAGAIAQIEQALANVEQALSSVGASLADIVRLRIHIPDRADVEPIMTYVGERFRGIDPSLTATCSPLCLAEYRVEIEVTALIGVRSADQKRLSVAL